MPPLSSLTEFRDDIVKMGTTFALALGSGWLFFQIGLPAPYLMGSLFGVWFYRRADPACTTLLRGRALVSYPCYFRASCDDRGDLRPTDVPANQPVVEKPVCDDGHHLYCLYAFIISY